MESATLQQQLAACILAALEQHQFAQPRTPDTSITDTYATAAAEAVARHLKVLGWVLVKKSGDWPMGVDMTPADLAETLRSTLRYPLLMARPPQRHPDRPTYLPRIAEAVAAHVVLSRWELAPALVKLPPLPRH